MKLKEIIEQLNLFQQERVPTEVRILEIATYIQTSSTRRTAKILSEFHSVSYTVIWKWVKKLKEKIASLDGEKAKKPDCVG